MTLQKFKAAIVKQILPLSIRELIFDGGLQIATSDIYRKPVFSTLLQWDGDIITQFDPGAAYDAADLGQIAVKHMQAVELQLKTLLRPLKRVEQAAAAGLFLGGAGSITAVQQVLEWAELAQAPAPSPFGFLEWSWILAAFWAAILIPLVQRLWPRVRRHAIRFAIRRLAILTKI